MQEFNSEQFNNLCSRRRQRIKRLPLNDQYSQSVTYQGRIYRYDPDYDCFYPAYDSSQSSHWENYGWIWVILVLSMLVLILE
jgi:ABC-type multidrug transport system permease subunit